MSPVWNQASYTGNEIKVQQIRANEPILNETKVPNSKIIIVEEVKDLEPLGFAGDKRQLSLQEILDKNFENSIVEANKNSNLFIDNPENQDINDSKPKVKSTKSLQNLAQELSKSKPAQADKPPSILKRANTEKDLKKNPNNVSFSFEELSK